MNNIIFNLLNDDGKLKQKYYNKCSNCKKEGLTCSLSLNDFCNLMIQAGIKSSDLGFSGNKYVLARFEDTGNYDINNCRFITQYDNMHEQKTYIHRAMLAKTKLICPGCGYKKDRHAKTCMNCNNKKKSSLSNKPTKEILQNLILLYPMTFIGKIYNVSDNTIRKWCKSYELPYKYNDIKILKNIITI